MADHALIRAVFGSSSSSSDDDDAAFTQFEGAPTARASSALHASGRCEATSVPGLMLARQLVPLETQERMMDNMRRAGWLDHPQTINQALCFGTLPRWLDELLSLLPAELMPPELGARRPLFDHMLVNIYPPGEGLCAHVDLPRFEDGIVSVSLAAPCVITYAPVAPVLATGSHDAGRPSADPADAVHSGRAAHGDVSGGGSGTDAGGLRAAPVASGASGSARVHSGGEAVGALADGGGGAVRLLLEPGDVLAMHGEARYEWTHGIDATMEDEWDGARVPRGTRVSITLRRVCADGWANLQLVPEPSAAYVEGATSA